MKTSEQESPLQPPESKSPPQIREVFPIHQQSSSGPPEPEEQIDRTSTQVVDDYKEGTRFSLRNSQKMGNSSPVSNNREEPDDQFKPLSANTGPRIEEFNTYENSRQNEDLKGLQTSQGKMATHKKHRNSTGKINSEQTPATLKNESFYKSGPDSIDIAFDINKNEYKALIDQAMELRKNEIPEMQSDLFLKWYEHHCRHCPHKFDFSKSTQWQPVGEAAIKDVGSLKYKDIIKFQNLEGCCRRKCWKCRKKHQKCALDSTLSVVDIQKGVQAFHIIQTRDAIKEEQQRSGQVTSTVSPRSPEDIFLIQEAEIYQEYTNRNHFQPDRTARTESIEKEDLPTPANQEKKPGDKAQVQLGIDGMLGNRVLQSKDIHFHHEKFKLSFVKVRVPINPAERKSPVNQPRRSNRRDYIMTENQNLGVGTSGAGTSKHMRSIHYDNTSRLIQNSKGGAETSLKESVELQLNLQQQMRFSQNEDKNSTFNLMPMNTTLPKTQLESQMYHSPTSMKKTHQLGNSPKSNHPSTSMDYYTTKNSIELKSSIFAGNVETMHRHVSNKGNPVRTDHIISPIKPSKVDRSSFKLKDGESPTATAPKPVLSGVSRPLPENNQDSVRKTSTKSENHPGEFVMESMDDFKKIKSIDPQDYKSTAVAISKELAQDPVDLQRAKDEEGGTNTNRQKRKLNQALVDLEESLEEQNKNMERLNLQRVLVQKGSKSKANPYMTYVYVNMLDHPQPEGHKAGGTANLSQHQLERRPEWQMGPNRQKMKMPFNHFAHPVHRSPLSQSPSMRHLSPPQGQNRKQAQSREKRGRSVERESTIIDHLMGSKHLSQKSDKKQISFSPPTVNSEDSENGIVLKIPPKIVQKNGISIPIVQLQKNKQGFDATQFSLKIYQDLQANSHEMKKREAASRQRAQYILDKGYHASINGVMQHISNNGMGSGTKNLSNIDQFSSFNSQQKQKIHDPSKETVSERFQNKSIKLKIAKTMESQEMLRNSVEQSLSNNYTQKTEPRIPEDEGPVKMEGDEMQEVLIDDHPGMKSINLQKGSDQSPNDISKTGGHSKQVYFPIDDPSNVIFLTSKFSSQKDQTTAGATHKLTSAHVDHVVGGGFKNITAKPRDRIVVVDKKKTTNQNQTDRTLAPSQWHGSGGSKVDSLPENLTHMGSASLISGSPVKESMKLSAFFQKTSQERIRPENIKQMKALMEKLNLNQKSQPDSNFGSIINYLNYEFKPSLPDEPGLVSAGLKSSSQSQERHDIRKEAAISPLPLKEMINSQVQTSSRKPGEQSTPKTVKKSISPMPDQYMKHTSLERLELKVNSTLQEEPGRATNLQKNETLELAGGEKLPVFPQSTKKSDDLNSKPNSPLEKSGPASRMDRMTSLYPPIDQIIRDSASLKDKGDEAQNNLASFSLQNTLKNSPNSTQFPNKPVSMEPVSPVQPGDKMKQKVHLGQLPQQISPMKIDGPIFKQALTAVNNGTTSFSHGRNNQPLEIRGDKKMLNMNYLALQQQMMMNNQNKITGILYEAGQGIKKQMIPGLKLNAGMPPIQYPETSRDHGNLQHISIYKDSQNQSYLNEDLNQTLKMGGASTDQGSGKKQNPFFPTGSAINSKESKNQTSSPHRQRDILNSMTTTQQDLMADLDDEEEQASALDTKFGHFLKQPKYSEQATDLKKQQSVKAPQSSSKKRKMVYSIESPKLTQQQQISLLQQFQQQNQILSLGLEIQGTEVTFEDPHKAQIKLQQRNQLINLIDKQHKSKRGQAPTEPGSANQLPQGVSQPTGANALKRGEKQAKQIVLKINKNKKKMETIIEKQGGDKDQAVVPPKEELPRPLLGGKILNNLQPGSQAVNSSIFGGQSVQSNNIEPAEGTDQNANDNKSEGPQRINNDLVDVKDDMDHNSMSQRPDKIATDNANSEIINQSSADHHQTMAGKFTNEFDLTADKNPQKKEDNLMTAPQRQESSESDPDRTVAGGVNQRLSLSSFFTNKKNQYSGSIPQPRIQGVIDSLISRDPTHDVTQSKAADHFTLHSPAPEHSESSPTPYLIEDIQLFRDFVLYYNKCRFKKYKFKQTLLKSDSAFMKKADTQNMSLVFDRFYKLRTKANIDAHIQTVEAKLKAKLDEIFEGDEKKRQQLLKEGALLTDDLDAHTFNHMASEQKANLGFKEEEPPQQTQSLEQSLEAIREQTEESKQHQKRISGVSQAKGTSRTQISPPIASELPAGFIGLEPGHPLVSLRMDRDQEIKLADSASPTAQMVEPVVEERTDQTKEAEPTQSLPKDPLNTDLLSLQYSQTKDEAKDLPNHIHHQNGTMGIVEPSSEAALKQHLHQSMSSTEDGQVVIIHEMPVVMDRLMKRLSSPSQQPDADPTSDSLSENKPKKDSNELSYEETKRALFGEKPEPEVTVSDSESKKPDLQEKQPSVQVTSGVQALIQDSIISTHRPVEAARTGIGFNPKPPSLVPKDTFRFGTREGTRHTAIQSGLDTKRLSFSVAGSIIGRDTVKFSDVLDFNSTARGQSKSITRREIMESFNKNKYLQDVKDKYSQRRVIDSIFKQKLSTLEATSSVQKPTIEDGFETQSSVAAKNRIDVLSLDGFEELKVGRQATNWTAMNQGDISTARADLGGGRILSSGVDQRMSMFGQKNFRKSHFVGKETVRNSLKLNHLKAVKQGSLRQMNNTAGPSVFKSIDLKRKSRPIKDTSIATNDDLLSDPRDELTSQALPSTVRDERAHHLRQTISSFPAHESAFQAAQHTIPDQSSTTRTILPTEPHIKNGQPSLPIKAVHAGQSRYDTFEDIDETVRSRKQRFRELKKERVPQQNRQLVDAMLARKKLKSKEYLDYIENKQPILPALNTFRKARGVSESVALPSKRDPGALTTARGLPIKPNPKTSALKDTSKAAPNKKEQLFSLTKHLIPRQDVSKMKDMYHIDLYDDLFRRTTEAHKTSFVPFKEKNSIIVTQESKMMEDSREPIPYFGPEYMDFSKFSPDKALSDKTKNMSMLGPLITNVDENDLSRLSRGVSGI